MIYPFPTLLTQQYQPTLRSAAHKALRTASDVLTEIDSTLTELRIVIHIELAKINEDAGMLTSAVDHVCIDCGL